MKSARELTLLDCFGLGINGIIGSGIFLLPAILFRRAGGAAPLAWLLVGAFCSLVALAFAEAAGRTDRQGGPYRYAMDAFGPWAALLVGWTSLVSTTLGFSAVSHAFAEHAAVWAGTREPLAQHAVVALLVIGLSTVNAIGARPGARTSAVVSVVKVAALLLFCGLGLPHVGAASFAALPSPDVAESSGILAAASAGLFATTGFEYVPVPAGEARSPQRDVGIAVVGSVLGATAIYAMVQLVIDASAPNLAHAKTPLVDAAAALFGPLGAHLMFAAALVSAFGFCSGSALVAPRYVESLAADGFLPAIFARRSARGTPTAAIVLVAVVVMILATNLDFVRLADVSVVAIVVQYIGTALAVIAMRRKEGPSPGFRLPFGPVIPILAAAGSTMFLVIADHRDVLVGAVVLAAGGLIGGVLRSRTRARA